ncbi:rhomboid family intramembrane serine protease [Clostridium uliginosum]|uniref:Rhomboid protease GluP n=1 Tax=Clostridium uliginosum TaxID=119641 RepID=A0A1I1RGC0_9CLOT|nr:rhomboid family intramembrane serine protease [Clostridium uliginosum]SFD33341.1 rhomboid protease GluP [Clostridium uliginosum]
MKDLEKNLYKYLIDKENFYMKQYFSNFHKEEYFIGIKELKDGIYCVLVTREEDEEINLQEALEYVKTLKKPFLFNLVVLSNGEYIGNNYSYVNKIVINEKDYSEILCDDLCTPLKNIINKVNNKKQFKADKFKKNKLSTLILIVINIIIFIITAILSKNIFSIDINVLIKFGAKYNEFIYQGEIWRLLTCAFLHGGIVHIAFNMYALYILGPQVEKIYGIKSYLTIYFIACITSSLLGLLINKYTISVGASGGIFGLLGAILVFGIRERHKIEKGYISNLIGLIVFNLMIGLRVANIDNLGHIGGFIGGVISSYLILIICKGKIFNN